MSNEQINTTLSLKDVYIIFTKYWNEQNRIWIHTEQGIDYNLKLSLNDFLHFTRIDKILKLSSASATRKAKYIHNVIMNERLNFKSLHQALINCKKNKHFNLKQKAIVELAIKIASRKPIFNKLSISANKLFTKVCPDYILINELVQDRYLILCNFMHMNSTLTNLSHAKSLMYCYHKHARFHDLNKCQTTTIKSIVFTKNSSNT